MLRRLLLISLLLTAAAARAQVYEPGYIVRASGDTLRGEVENAFWDEPPTFIHFRPGPAAPSQLLLPRQLRAVGFTGGRYFQYQVLPIDHAAHTALNMLPAGNAQRVQQDSLLAEVLIDGPVMLWRVRREDVLHLLLRRPGQPVLELADRRYLRRSPEDNRQIVVDGNNYRSQLTQYFGDCPAAVQAVAGTDYSAAGLVQLVRTYYQACAPGRGVAHSYLARSVPRRRLAAQGGVLAGLRYNRLGEGACTDCAVRPFGGLYLEVLQPSRTLAVYGELSVSAFTNAVKLYAYPTNTYNDYSFRGLLTTARLGLRYLSPLSHEQYLLAGLGLELNFVGSATVTQTSGPPLALDPGSVDYATPALLPNLTLGWRRQCLTLLLDGQLYRSRFPEGFAATVFGNAGAVRVGASFRLGPHPDQVRPLRAAP